jgi:hypothetical protein
MYCSRAQRVSTPLLVLRKSPGEYRRSSEDTWSGPKGEYSMYISREYTATDVGLQAINFWNILWCTKPTEVDIHIRCSQHAACSMQKYQPSGMEWLKRACWYSWDCSICSCCLSFHPRTSTSRVVYITAITIYLPRQQHVRTLLVCIPQYFLYLCAFEARFCVQVL